MQKPDEFKSLPGMQLQMRPASVAGGGKSVHVALGSAQGVIKQALISWQVMLAVRK